MEVNNNSYLANEKIGKLMRRYAIPCIISLLVGALYNIVDQIFIANATYLGSYGNAANTVVFPLTIIALGIAVMIGDGCCAFISISLGKQNMDDATHSVGNSILLCVLSSVILMVLYLGFLDRILIAFGGNVNAETFALSKESFFWISLGIPFYMFAQALNPIIRADGSPKFAMISTLVGAVMNICLDPLMLSMLIKGLSSQKQCTEQDERMLELLLQDANYVNEENLRDVLKWYKEKEVCFQGH